MSTAMRSTGSGYRVARLSQRTELTWGLHALTTPFGAPRRVGYSWAVQSPHALPHDPSGHPRNGRVRGARATLVERVGTRSARFPRWVGAR